MSAPTCVTGSCACTNGGAVSNGVCCQPGLTGCAGKCFDLQSDNGNCGGCGLACPTGCTAGRCVVALATGEFSQGIAVDSQYVWWTNITKAALSRVPLGGGTVGTLATGQNQPFAVTVDGTAAYFTNSSSVVKATSSSGFVSTLAGSQAAPTAITTDGTNVFWTNNSSPNGSVVRVSNTGGTPLTLASGLNGAAGVAVGGSFVYYTAAGDSSGNGIIGRAPIGGGGAIVLRSGVFQPISVVVDSSNLYFASYGSTGTDSTINRMPLAGGAVTPLASGQSYFLDGNIVLDGGYIYWANFGTGSIARVPVGGGPVSLIATGLPNPMSVAVNAQSVFFSSYGGTVGKITPK